MVGGMTVAGARGRAPPPARDLARFAAGEGTFSSLTARGRGRRAPRGERSPRGDASRFDADGRQHVPVSLGALTERGLQFEPSVHLVGGRLVPEAGAALRHGARDDDSVGRDTRRECVGGTRHGRLARRSRRGVYTREANAREREGCSRGRRARVALVRIGVCARGGVLCGPQLSPQGKRALLPERFVTPNPFRKRRRFQRRSAFVVGIRRFMTG